MADDTIQGVKDSAKLGPALATLLVAGNMIGSGVFLLPATLAVIGSISLIGWAVAGLGALLLAAVFSALVILRPDIDGVADYASAGFGRYAGFQSGFAYWMSNWTGTVAVAVAVTGYLTVFVPALHRPMASALGSIAIIWLLILFNIIGPRFVGKLSGLTLAAGLLPVGGVALFGWFWFEPKLFLDAWNPAGLPAATAVQRSLVLVFWAYTGMESAIVAAKVVRRPERNVPIATIGGVAFATVIFMLTSAAIAGIVPDKALAASAAPYAAAAARALGPWAAGLVTVCALLKTAGTAAGITLLTGETTRASAATGYFPKFLARVRPNGAPVTALLFLGVLMTVTLVLSISPTVGRQFAALIDVSTVLTLVMYGWCALAVLRVAGAIASPAWRAATRAAALGAFGFCVWVVATSEPKLLLLSLAVLAATLPLWGLVLLAKRARADKTASSGAAI